MESTYTVYVLYSDKHDRYYTGSTSDLKKRVEGHNHPRNKGWTKRYSPWRLIYHEECKNKADALRRERWLKSGVGRNFIKSKHSI